MTEQLCGLCEQPEGLHEHAAHKFSPSGEFIAREPGQKPSRPQAFLAVPDPALRALLIEKGLINYDELAAKEVEILGRHRVPERPSVDG